MERYNYECESCLAVKSWLVQEIESELRALLAAEGRTTKTEGYIASYIKGSLIAGTQGEYVLKIQYHSPVRGALKDFDEETVRTIMSDLASLGSLEELFLVRRELRDFVAEVYELFIG